MDDQHQLIEVVDLTEDTRVESDSAGIDLAVNNNNDKLMNLRRVNHNALQMIKSCLKKIQQQDKEIKKIKQDKELTCAQVSDNHEEYEEILKLKDQYIEDLENKVRDFQKQMENAQNRNASGNRQQLLTRHLQGLTNFLGKLLSHKCVLDEDKRKLARSIIVQCLALPLGLELDESMAIQDLTMDDRVDMLEDLTNMFGHHLACDEPSRPSVVPSADFSDSDCWSKHDRVGAPRDPASNSNMGRARLAKLSFSSSDDDLEMLGEYDAEVRERERDRQTAIEHCARFNAECNEMKAKLEYTAKEIDQLSAENLLLKAALESERLSLSEANKSIETFRATITNLEERIKEVGQLLRGGL